MILQTYGEPVTVRNVMIGKTALLFSSSSPTVMYHYASPTGIIYQMSPSLTQSALNKQ